ncbi:MAG: hypothetical protein U1G08_21645 [Verrucomicrobiota bacterium]
MGAILTWAGILVVIGIVSIWWSRRTTEDHEMDSSQWIDTDFSDHQGHAHGDYSPDGDTGGDSSSDGADSGGSGGD